MAVDLSPLFNGWQGFGIGGLPLSLGTIDTFQAGTSTPAATYTTPSGLIANSNPIVLGSDGRPPQEIWLTRGQAYRFVLKDALGTQIFTYDNIVGIEASGGVDSLRADLANTAAVGEGDALIGVLRTETGAVATTQHDVNQARWWNVTTDGGCPTDGTSDCAAAFTASLTARTGGVVYVPHIAAGYKFLSGFTIPANTTLYFESRQTTKLVHAFNGDFITMGDRACIVNGWLDGNAAGGFTGKALLFTGTNGGQCVQGCRITDWDGACMDFAVGAGSQSSFHDIRMARSAAGTGTGRYAVVISATQQLSAVPRKFSHIETDGTCSFDFGGCNDTFISDSFLADLNYTADTRGVQITGCRIANAASLTINGHQNSLVACDIAPQVTIASGADAITIGPGAYNGNPQVIDNSGNGRNQVYTWAVSYTPTWTSGGTAPSLGDGTLVATASRQGNIVTVMWTLTPGAATTFGTGDLRISLPTFFPNNNGTVQVTGIVNVNPTGAGAGFYTGIHLIPAGQQYASLRRDTSNSITSTSPGTFQATSANVMRGEFSYLVG